MSEEILQQAEQAEEESTYTKQTWVDHFVDEQGFVVQQGTAMDALHFNHMEDGIGNAHDLIAEEKKTRSEETTAIKGRLDDLEDGTKMAGQAAKVQKAIHVGDVDFDGSAEKTVDAMDGIKITDGKIKHTNAVDAGTASGGSGAKEFGGTIDIPSVTYDEQGHITGKDKTTVTLPSNDATTSKHGLMSTSDKTKLNGIETGAQKNTVTGIKGGKESAYRTGSVNITLANILGSTPIGDDFTGIYYNGSTFVAQNPALQSTSWARIAELSAAGKASKVFKVGDEKTITLTTGESVTLVIMGFDHDNKTGGGKAGITFGMKNLLSTTYKMNATDTNTGGWDQSQMRTETMATLLSQLPTDLRNVIKAVDKKATAGAQSTTITTSSDKLWLFSEKEIDDTTSSGYADEGVQYEYWRTVKDGKVNADRVKTRNGSANLWWLRSPYVSDTVNFRYVGVNGYVGSGVAGYAGGVCFGFCV